MFAVRSTKGVKRLSKAERNTITLQGNLLDAFIGILLSDGCLQRRSPTANTRFLFAQSGKLNKREYFTLIFGMFASFMSAASSELGIVVTTFTDARTGAEYSRVSFATMAFPCFNQYHDLFYNGRVKVIPSIIGELLTPCGLAH